MNELQKEAAAIKPFLTSARRRLHSFAECGFSLPKTTEYVKNALLSMGYKPADLGKGGVVCELSAGDRGTPAILLRADMDALPLEEETTLPFRAENGCMHACGHDMHAAMLLGAAYILKKQKNGLKAPVRFLFQPAEEILAGAEDMKRAGVLTGVMAAFMLHAVTAVPFKTGTLLLPPTGVAAPAACFFELNVLGKSAHIGEREKGADAIEGAVALFTAMQKEREKMGEDLLLSVGKWQAGDAANIVPAKATLSGSIRSMHPEKLGRFGAWLEERCERFTGDTSAHVTWLGGCPPLENDPRLLSMLEEALSQNGFHAKKMPPSRGNAAEDFAVLANEVPAVALAIAAGESGRGYEYPLHHPRVLFDEDALPVGAAVYALAAMQTGLQTFTNQGGA